MLSTRPTSWQRQQARGSPRRRSRRSIPLPRLPRPLQQRLAQQQQLYAPLQHLLLNEQKNLAFAKLAFAFFMLQPNRVPSFRTLTFAPISVLHKGVLVPWRPIRHISPSVFLDMLRLL